MHLSLVWQRLAILARHGSCFGSSCYVVVSHVTLNSCFGQKWLF